MNITVITPSIRPEGLKVVEEALKNQQFDGKFEWLIGCKEVPEQYPYAIWVEDDFKEGFWTLNRIYNKLFEAAQGELVVSLQDNIWVPPDGLQKFWDAYAETTDALISGVGDQYEKLDEQGKPSVKIWADPRRTAKYGTFYECMWNDIEWNWAAIPKAIWKSVGGMDEGLDFLGYGGDQLQFCDRVSDQRIWRFFIDQDNESFTLRHDRSYFGGEEKWDENHVLFNGKYTERKTELIKKGSWPVLIDKAK